MPIEIGLTEFTLDVPALPEKELEAYSSTLFDTWERQLGIDLPLPDYALRLEIEEGSLKGRGRVVVAAIGIFTAVSQAGGFISGTKEIIWAVRKGGTVLAEAAASPYRGSNPSIRVKRGTGKLGEIERLIARVENGQLERHEAAILAQALFEDADDEPGIKELERAVLDSVAAVPRAPTQLVFPHEDFETLMIGSKSEGSPSSPPRRPRPKPAAPAPERFRADVWRESKKGPKRIRVTPL